MRNTNKQFYTSCKVCNAQISTINEKYSLIKCSNCKLVFCQTIFSSEDFEKTYNNLYNVSNQYETHQKEYEKLQNNVNFTIGRPKLKVINYLFERKVNKICEIGAGVGIVAHYLKKKQKDYIGVELDIKTVEKAQSLGLNIKNGNFSIIKNFPDKYEAIIAFEVIEHLQDLDLFFKVVIEKLDEGGYLGFTVPNYDKRKNYKNSEEKIYQSGPPIHLNFFTIESIHKIAKFYQFEVVFCEAKKFPYLNLKNKDTYKGIFKALFNKYYGSTLMCLIKKSYGTT